MGVGTSVRGPLRVYLSMGEGDVGAGALPRVSQEVLSPRCGVHQGCHPEVVCCGWLYHDILLPR